jgi:origin recognition complex subunit 4
MLLLLLQVIAMKHQTEIYEGEPLNFEMVYRRYLKFSSQNLTVQNVEKPIILKAFEHLKVRSYSGNI